MGLNANSDDANYDQTDDHGALDVIGDEADAEAAGCGVQGCDEAFDNNGRQAIEAGQKVDDLLEGGEFGD